MPFLGKRGRDRSEKAWEEGAFTVQSVEGESPHKRGDQINNQGKSGEKRGREEGEGDRKDGAAAILLRVKRPGWVNHLPLTISKRGTAEKRMTK